METAERMILYITVLGSFALVEGVIGIFHFNVHLIRDFLNSILMLTTLGLSAKAIFY